MSDEYNADTQDFCDKCAVSRGTNGCTCQWVPPTGSLSESLDAVRDFLTEYVVFPDQHCEVATVLWCAHAHALDAFDSTPRLAFLSPEPGSGKSRALEVITTLVPHSMHAVNATPAALFRAVSDLDNRPTILFDEIDTVFGPKAKDNEEVRGFLNAGHRRGAVAYRCVGMGTQQTVVPFPSFCAVAIAGLNDVPDTIATRSVIVRMRKRAPKEQVSPWRTKTGEPIGTRLRLALSSAVSDVRGDLERAEPHMPPGVDDRPADVWEPLLAVADCAGGEWPNLARGAAVALTAPTDTQMSLGVQLLADLREVYTDKGKPLNLSTPAILEALQALEESPWGDLRGKPIDARYLARTLKRYSVTRTKFRDSATTQWGYNRADLGDVWERYLPPLSLPPEHGNNGNTGTQNALVPDVAGTDENSGTQNRVHTRSSQPIHEDRSLVPDVPDLRERTAEAPNGVPHAPNDPQPVPDETTATNDWAE